MAVKYELRAKTGEKADGTAFYMTIGRIMETSKGGYAAKFDFLPVGWDGWAFLSTPKPKDGQKDAPKEDKGRPQDMTDDVPW